MSASLTHFGSQCFTSPLPQTLSQASSCSLSGLGGCVGNARSTFVPPSASCHRNTRACLQTITYCAVSVRIAANRIHAHRTSFLHDLGTWYCQEPCCKAHALGEGFRDFLQVVIGAQSIDHQHSIRTQTAPHCISQEAIPKEFWCGSQN